ncbi:MAG: amylo-alpha-1,6-glucosidase [Chitinophagales bacterium]
MNLSAGKEILHNYAEAIQHEWLETNGLGGFASSTVIGCNTRRYHGLLTAATNPPVGRMSLISRLDETILIGDNKFELGCNNYGDTICPNGNQFLESFSKNYFPEFIYEAGGVRLEKTIAMVHGENTTLIRYKVLRADRPFRMELLPLISVCDYHSLMRSNENINRFAIAGNGVLKIRAYPDTPEIFIYVPGAGFISTPDWYFHFNYEAEKLRGLDYVEDLFSHGKFIVNLKGGDVLEIILSTENPDGRKAHQLFAYEQTRREKVVKNFLYDNTVQALVLAADQFVVRREQNLKTVIAGYHWFTDWGRDTMISLPGLCLVTNRFSDAKKILSAFANSVSMGMLPNRFQEYGEKAEYNNVDGTLWFFIAVYRYLLATRDQAFVTGEILPVLKDIIEWHYKGTRYKIHADRDELLFSGETGIQLTWMDAKAGDWVVTPRTGKAVEVNALWYNALCIYALLLKLNGEKKAAEIFAEKSRVVKKNFRKLFWNETTGYLNDVINNELTDSTLRPNQLFALGLCFPLIKGEKAIRVLKTVREKLYTPVGLRTLSPGHPEYKGEYAGNQKQRDAAYHQGTVWSWLLGIYIDALMKSGRKSSIRVAIKVIEDFKSHLAKAGISSISEIFDGDEPHTPRGCVAQSWSVAEILRVIMEYKLLDPTRFK